MESNINKSEELRKFREITSVIYQNWWAERNGGNISVLLNKAFVTKYFSELKPSKSKQLSVPCKELKDRYFLVTGSGKYYRNISKIDETKLHAGIIKISGDGNSYDVVWGFEGECWPTSELPSHLLSHISRLGVNEKHTTVIHAHPTDLIALTFVEKHDEKEFSLKMWRMISEASVVFPEGIGLLKWMVPGSDEIGIATAEKMKRFRSVIWAHHGIFCSGENLDEALGLLECIEKSAKIYLKILQSGKKIISEISNENIIKMSEFFGYQVNKKILE